MKPFVFLLTLFLSAMHSHSQSGNTLVGEYYLQSVRETASGFRLNADSSFDFFFSQGALDRSGKGRWRVENGILQLDSEKWPGTDFRLIESGTVSEKGFFIEIAEENKNILAFVDCILKNGDKTKGGSSNSHGEIFIENAEADSILLQFRFVPERISVFRVKDQTHNYYRFGFEPWMMEVFFKMFTLDITNDGLKGKHPLLRGDAFLYRRSK
ncbi:hypothetical protein ACFSQD_02410 [Flavihumibacter stibioxidans]|uniref:Uncharacterized protein n=1 Tax=Flavihumibacter stibioxidans TaxID=1834163 RepID=A0ABR7MCI2_9BACT|nr:hypothetical protein [Flavihumibacter stibioxidans]MBC6492336.1 hypothetical protein [Flavihumibacter stibioxidans]